MSLVFDWLVPGELAACANPSFGEAVVAELRAGGIKLLVNLHERPDPPELLAQLGAHTVHLPVADFDAPTQDQLSTGSPPADAIARVRAARPGSLETDGQERAVLRYARRVGGVRYNPAPMVDDDLSNRRGGRLDRAGR